MNLPPTADPPAKGLIDRTFRWFGEHPKVCLVPVLLLAALAGANLLVHLYAKKVLVVEPFGYLGALALVLATLASLAVALAWWVRRENAAQVAAAVEQILAHMAGNAHGVIVPPPDWPRPPAHGNAYRFPFPPVEVESEHARHGARHGRGPEEDWTRELLIDPPSGDVSGKSVA
jgi:hypothetical protein